MTENNKPSWLKNLLKSFIFSSVIIFSIFLLHEIVPEQRTKITNIKNNETIILKKQFFEENIYGLKINIFGKISGDATISLMLNNNIYKTKKISNTFDFTWNGDWYEENATIIYIPNNVKKGILKINYGFKEL